MLVGQEVTQQATHGRSLPSLAAWEEGSIRPQGQLAGVERGEERRDVKERRKRVRKKRRGRERGGKERGGKERGGKERGGRREGGRREGGREGGRGGDNQLYFN